MKFFTLRLFENPPTPLGDNGRHASEKAKGLLKVHLFIGILILALIRSSLGSPSSVLIRSVLDGDTVVLSSGEPVRYLGIDAPEIGRKGAKSDFMALESRNYNHRLVRNARVRLELDEEPRDGHGRMLAYVFLESGEMVNLLLVRRGLAFVSIKKPNVRYFPLLLDAQRQAMMENIGIWSKLPERVESFYRANRSSSLFHRPDCPLGLKIAPRNLLRFDTRQQACWEGYSPCRRCKP